MFVVRPFLPYGVTCGLYRSVQIGISRFTTDDDIEFQIARAMVRYGGAATLAPLDGDAIGRMLLVAMMVRDLIKSDDRVGTGRVCVSGNGQHVQFAGDGLSCSVAGDALAVRLMCAHVADSAGH